MPTHSGNDVLPYDFEVFFKRLPWNVIVNHNNGSWLMAQGWWGPAQAAKNKQQLSMYLDERGYSFFDPDDSF